MTTVFLLLLLCFTKCTQTPHKSTSKYLNLSDMTQTILCTSKEKGGLFIGKKWEQLKSLFFLLKNQFLDVFTYTNQTHTKGIKGVFTRLHMPLLYKLKSKLYADQKIWFKFCYTP